MDSSNAKQLLFFILGKSASTDVLDCLDLISTTAQFAQEAEQWRLRT